MTPGDALRKKAAGMKHAIIRSIAVLPDGRVMKQPDLHYLTCEACKLLELAAEIDTMCAVPAAE